MGLGSYKMVRSSKGIFGIETVAPKQCSWCVCVHDRTARWAFEQNTWMLEIDSIID